jgi:signal peptidase II
MLKKYASALPGTAALALLLLADYATKMFAFAHFGTPMEIIPGVLSFSLSLNPGIAWSVPIPNSLMIFTTPVLITAIVFLIIKNCKFSHFITKTAICLILAGGFGNLFNRLFFGAVIDFIDFSFFPSFNLADSYLTIAGFLLILFYGRITLSKSN